MSPVADDFAAISKRLKIEQEAAAETAARTRHNETERQSDPQDAFADIAACA